MSSKQNQREDISLLLNRAGKLVTVGAVNAQVLNTFFTSVIIGIAGPQAADEVAMVTHVPIHQ